MGHSPAQANTSAEFHGYLVRLAANSQRDNWFLTDTVYVSIVNSGDHPINWDPCEPSKVFANARTKVFANGLEKAVKFPGVFGLENSRCFRPENQT